MEKNLINTLKANINHMSKIEKRIARLIIDNPDEFITFSMSRLSVLADVSQGSINNFAKKYVCGGFPELKLRVSASIGEKKVQKFSLISDGDTVKDALRKNIESQMHSYELAFEMNDEQTLKKATDMILCARKVEIYGIFTSAAVATDFCYQLQQLGIPASFVSDILTCAMSAAMLDENDLVIAISSSGKTRDVIDAVKNARENNAGVISITSNPNSPLARLSHCVLIAPPGGNSLVGNSVEIRSSQLILADAICSYISSVTGKKSDSKYFKLKKILNSHSVEEIGNE